MNRSTKRKSSTLLSVAALVLVLVGCSTSNDSSRTAGSSTSESSDSGTPGSSRSSEPPVSTSPVTGSNRSAGASSTSDTSACADVTVAYATFQASNPYFAIVDKGIQAAAKKARINLYMVDNDLNADKAISNANLIAARPGVKVVLESNYYQAANATIAKIFERAELPVIAVDIAIPGASYYGANNKQAGELAGEGLVAAANSKWGDGSVDLALVENQSGPGQELIRQRTDGIVAGIKAAEPSLPVGSIIKFEGGTSPDAAASAVSALLTAHPDAKHIIIGMLGDSNGVAAVNAAKVAGRVDQVLVAGQGGDGVGVATLEGPASAFIGTTDYRPNNYGNDLIALACDLIAGKTIPAENYIKHIFLTPENVRQYYPNGQS